MDGSMKVRAARDDRGAAIRAAARSGAHGPPAVVPRAPIASAPPAAHFREGSSGWHLPEIMSLQRTLGNRAVQRLVAPPARPVSGLRPPPATASPAAAIQRLVVYLPQGGRISSPFLQNDVENFVEMVSIGYALQRAGPPVLRLDDADFSAVKDGDRIFIVGHGSPGSAGGVKADELLKALIKDGTGLKKSVKAVIVFTSCFAGAEGANALPSMVHGVSAGLKAYAPGTVVIGGEGPTIKGEALGNAFFVAQPGGRDQFESAKKSMAPVAEVIKKEYSEWRAQNKQASYEDKAKRAAALAVKHNYQGDLLKAIRELEKGGPKVVANVADPKEAQDAARGIRIEIDGVELKGEDKQRYLELGLAAV